VHRRTFVAALAALAGCTGPNPPGDDRTTEPRATTTATPGTPTRTDAPSRSRTHTAAPRTMTPTTPDGDAAATMTRLEDCPTDSGEATASVDGGDVAVRGCIRGADACTVAVLRRVAREDGELRIVVATEGRRDPDEACAEVVVDLGYEVAVAAGSRPETVVVVHDGVGGRTEVARVGPD